MSGPKHTPLDQLVEDALDEYSSGAYEKFSDARRALESITREAYELGRRDAAPRLAAELAAWQQWAERWGRDIETSVSVSPITHNELVERLAATNAALREAGES